MKQTKQVYFEKKGSVCVIPSGTSPKLWQHFFANEKYAVMSSVTGAGYSVSPAIEGRFVNFYDPKNPQTTGRFVYIKHHTSGKIWNIATLPDNKPQTTETRFGSGWTKINAEFKGITASLTVSVPEEKLPVEIWEISFSNNAEIDQQFTFYPYIEFFLGGAMGAQDEPEWYTKTAYVKNDNLIEETVYLPDTEDDNVVRGWMAPLFDIDGYYLVTTQVDF